MIDIYAAWLLFWEALGFLLVVAAFSLWLLTTYLGAPSRRKTNKEKKESDDDG